MTALEAGCPLSGCVAIREQQDQDEPSSLCAQNRLRRHTGLVLGCPHPNEPVGAMMIEFFAESLAKNRRAAEGIDYTWYFVKAWDADSVKLNEGWFKGPFTIKNYVRNHFRPALFEQVDWSFPLITRNCIITLAVRRPWP